MLLKCKWCQRYFSNHGREKGCCCGSCRGMYETFERNKKEYSMVYGKLAKCCVCGELMGDRGYSRVHNYSDGKRYFVFSHFECKRFKLLNKKGVAE
jgi:hypothetical protein